MLELIERYKYGLKKRLYEIVNHLDPQNLTGASRANYIHDLEDVRTMRPSSSIAM